MARSSLGGLILLVGVIAGGVYLADKQGIFGNGGTGNGGTGNGGGGTPPPPSGPSAILNEAVALSTGRILIKVSGDASNAFSLNDTLRLQGSGLTYTGLVVGKTAYGPIVYYSLNYSSGGSAGTMYAGASVTKV